MEVGTHARPVLSCFWDCFDFFFILLRGEGWGGRLEGRGIGGYVCMLHDGWMDARSFLGFGVGEGEGTRRDVILLWFIFCHAMPCRTMLCYALELCCWS